MVKHLFISKMITNWHLSGKPLRSLIYNSFPSKIIVDGNSAFHMAQFIARTPADARTFLQNVFIHQVGLVMPAYFRVVIPPSNLSPLSRRRLIAFCCRAF